MFDIWLGDLELTTLTLIISIFVVLPVQLLLCFNSKNQTIRLPPVTVFTIVAPIFILMSVSTTGWNVLLFIFLAVFSAIMLLMCGIGWGIWAVLQRIKKKKQS